ncbi:hypothetical protein Cdeb_01545 [Caldibacillus debilis GB1]|uniref:Uncharacterized protein n=1 Tax=Caldibacillus debilis GB1 TaxID=1339248 RepID=A0A420VE26_9BACI|nr:hypothetical protein Cdeb_01545 [Caldibacillus debilis GB1]
MTNIRPKMNCSPNVRHDDSGKCSSFWAVFVFSPGTGRILSRTFWRIPIFPQGPNRVLSFPEESAGSRSRTEQQDSRCPDPFPKGMFTGRRGVPSPIAGKGSGCPDRHLFGKEGRKHTRPVKPLHRPRPFRRFGRFNAGARRPIIEIRNLKRQIAQADKRCRTKAKRRAAEFRADNVSVSKGQNGRNGPEIMEI